MTTIKIGAIKYFLSSRSKYIAMGEKIVKKIKSLKNQNCPDNARRLNLQPYPK